MKSLYLILCICLISCTKTKVDKSLDVSQKELQHINAINHAVLQALVRGDTLAVENEIVNYDKFIQRNPHFWEGYIRKAAALYEIGKHDEAFRLLESTRTQFPERASDTNNLLFLYHQKETIRDTTIYN